MCILHKTPVEILQKHIRALEDSGRSLREVARIAQISPGYLCSIKKGRPKRVSVETYNAILTVTVLS